MEELKQIDPATAVSFSGHRPDRLPGHGDPDTQDAQNLITALREQIVGAVGRGKYIFLHGAMAGFDIFAAEQVIEMKKQHPQIQLVTVAPYRAQFFTTEDCWTREWIERAKKVFALHDIGVVVEHENRKGLYYKRNRVLVDHSSGLICYWDGKGGGTKYTVGYAFENKKPVINLYRG